MESEKHFIPVQRSGRFYTLGQFTDKTKNIWFVCHGYGQLASLFIQKFNAILDESTFIIAPEGLSRFYLDANWQKVGASWMTKEDRELEIQEQIEFLTSVFNTFLIDNNHKINFLGFSQGVPTICRFLKKSNLKCDNLILWAGMVPQEPNGLDFKTNKVWIVVGNQDQFIDNKSVDLVKDLFEQSKCNYELIIFEGKHTIPEDVLLKVNSKII